MTATIPVFDLDLGTVFLSREEIAARVEQHCRRSFSPPAIPNGQSPRDKSPTSSQNLVRTPGRKANLASAFLLGLMILCAPFFFTGCQTPLPITANTSLVTMRKIESLVKLAAYNGTTVALAEHPEWRAGFELAKTDLDALASLPDITIADIVLIVQRLPVGELKSAESKLLVGNLTILLTEFSDGIAIDTDLSTLTQQNLKRVAGALARGIELGL